MLSLTRITQSLVALSLASAPAFAVSPITDSTFANTNWSLTTFITPGSGTIDMVGQDTGVGNVAPSRRVRLNPAGGGRRVSAFHRYIAPGQVINPAVDNIGSLTFSLDRVYGGGFGVASFTLAIEQNGVIYITGPELASGGLSGFFSTHTLTYALGDFVRADGLPGFPNFSTTGSPINVGFWTTIATAPQDGGYNHTLYFDNFSVTVNPPVVTPSSLKHEWNFETNMEDCAGNADGVLGSVASYRNAATGHNVPVDLGTALFVGNAVSLLTPAVVEQSSLYTLGTGNFTVAFWYFNQNTDADQDPIIDCGNTNGWRVQFINGLLRFTDAAGGTPVNFDSAPVTTGAWHHVAFVCDRNGSGTNTWYVDGLPTATLSAAGMSNIVHDQDMYIGRFTETTNEGMDGLLGKLQIFSVALTAAQIDLLADPDTTCPGDSNGDNAVNFDDIVSVLSRFGSICN
jgi:hypothetical protein